MAVYGYARVSTLTQAREGESLEAQKRQILSYAISKGLDLDESNIFIEAGVSGGIEFEHRHEGSKLNELAQAGDLIIFPKLDRAFRNTRNALNVLHEMKERAVHIHFIDLGGDVTGNGIGAIIFTILSAFATFEKERIATRIREVKQIKKSQGKFTGGKAGFGYEVIDGVKVAKKDEQKIISEMRRLKSLGKSYRYIAGWLKAKKDVEMSFMGVKGILIK
ncbi:PinR Site-specific recombinases, DNA invertase Pin homologs [Methylophilaceae bacterium]